MTTFLHLQEEARHQQYDMSSGQLKLKSKLITKFEKDDFDEPVEALDLRLTKVEEDYSELENPLIEIKQETPQQPEEDEQPQPEPLIKLEAPQRALDYSEVEQLTAAEADDDLRDDPRRRQHVKYLHPNYQPPSVMEDRRVEGGRGREHLDLDLEVMSRYQHVDRYGGRGGDDLDVVMPPVPRSEADIQRVVIKPSHRRKSPNPRYSPYEMRRGYSLSVDAVAARQQSSDLSPSRGSNSYLDYAGGGGGRGGSPGLVVHQRQLSPFSRVSSPDLSSQYHQQIQHGQRQRQHPYHHLSPRQELGGRDHSPPGAGDSQRLLLPVSSAANLSRQSPIFAQMLAANSRSPVLRNALPSGSELTSKMTANPSLIANLRKSMGLSGSPLLFQNDDEKNLDGIMETADDMKNYDNPLLMGGGGGDHHTSPDDVPRSPPRMSPIPGLPDHHHRPSMSSGGRVLHSHVSTSQMYRDGLPPSSVADDIHRRHLAAAARESPPSSKLSYPGGAAGMMEADTRTWDHHRHNSGGVAIKQEDPYSHKQAQPCIQVPGMRDLDRQQGGQDYAASKRVYGRPSVLARASLEDRLWPPPPQHHQQSSYLHPDRGHNSYNQDSRDLSNYQRLSPLSAADPRMSGASDPRMSAADPRMSGADPRMSGADPRMPDHRKFRTEDLSISHSADYHRSVIVKHNSSTDSVERDEQHGGLRGADEPPPRRSSLVFNNKELQGLLKLQAAAKQMLNAKSSTMQAGNFLNNLHMNPYLMDQPAFPFPPTTTSAAISGDIKREPPYSSFDPAAVAMSQDLRRRYSVSPLGGATKGMLPGGGGGYKGKLSPMGGQYSVPGDEGEEDDSSFNQKGKRGRPRKHAPKIPLPPLYVFIRNLLHNTAYNPSVVAWVDEETGCFKVNNTTEFAKTWGKMKANRSEEMTYEKMSRAMRYHYGSEKHGRKGHLAMVKEKRLYYRFGELAVNWRHEDMEHHLRSPCNIHPLCRNHVCLWTKE